MGHGGISLVTIFIAYIVYNNIKKGQLYEVALWLSSACFTLLSISCKMFDPVDSASYSTEAKSGSETCQTRYLMWCH